MSTRGIIARPTGDTWEGREHHWDSYPSGLGAALFHAYHFIFHRDIAAMRAFLIDNHPGGWSTIVDVDWSKEPGFNEWGTGSNDDPAKKDRPQCYCHGDRSEEGYLFTRQDADHDKEYAYILGDTALIIEAWRGGAWQHLAIIPWTEHSTDFKALNTL